MPDEFVRLVSERYIELYEKVTGKEFIKESNGGRSNQSCRDAFERFEINLLVLTVILLVDLLSKVFTKSA